MLEEKKALSDEEIKNITGGKMAPGNTFYGGYAYINQGEWFKKRFEPDIAYNVASAGNVELQSFIANRFWYRNGEVWNYGTCSFFSSDYFDVIEDPTIIHDEYTPIKPF